MTIRAVVMPAPGSPVEIRSFDEPKLGPGEVRLRTLVSEVCGTDVHLQHGRLAGVPYPLIPGHVSVGAVTETCGAVTDVEGRLLEPGDVVTFLDVHGPCGQCWHCLVGGSPTRCVNRHVYGISYGAEDGLHGGWSEQIVLRAGMHAIRMLPGVAPEAWIGGGCGLPTALHAVDRAELRLMERVLVLGAGPVGLCVAALAAASGAGWVGVCDPADVRRLAAPIMGADAVFSPDDAYAAVSSATGCRGADVVIEASGAPPAARSAMELARDGGRVVIVGHYSDAGEIGVNPHLHINRKHLDVRGCWGAEYHHFHRAMEAVARTTGRVPWQSLISERYPLERAQDALDAVAERRIVKALIVP